MSEKSRQVLGVAAVTLLPLAYIVVLFFLLVHCIAVIPFAVPAAFLMGLFSVTGNKAKANKCTKFLDFVYTPVNRVMDIVEQL
jgi:hypothetical protein